MRKTVVSLLLILVMTLTCITAFAADSEKTAYVASEGGLYMRSEAKLDATVITGLSYGAEVTVLGYTKNGFARVSYRTSSGSFIGYVWAEFLETKSETAEEEELPEGETMYVSSYTGLVMREWPDFESKELGRFGLNTEVLVLETKGLWSKCIVVVGGEQVRGFMWNEYLVPEQFSEEAAWAVHAAISSEEGESDDSDPDNFDPSGYPQ